MKNTTLSFKAAAVVSSVLLAGTYVAFRAGVLTFGGSRETVQPVENVSSSVGATLDPSAHIPYQAPNAGIPVGTHGEKERAMMFGPKSAPIEFTKPATIEPERVLLPGSKSDANLSGVEAKSQQPMPAITPPEPPPHTLMSGSKSLVVDFTPPVKIEDVKLHSVVPVVPVVSPKTQQSEGEKKSVKLLSGSKSGVIFEPNK